MRPAILDQLSAAQKAKLFDELIEFLATPSFGAWPKREIEVRVVAALSATSASRSRGSQRS